MAWEPAAVAGHCAMWKVLPEELVCARNTAGLWACAIARIRLRLSRYNEGLSCASCANRSRFVVGSRDTTDAGTLPLHAPVLM